MDYKELKPVPSYFTLDGIEYKLRAFDLNAKVWADTFFATANNPQGLQVLSERLRNFEDYTPCIQTCWHLMNRDDQLRLGGFDNFLSAIEKSKPSKYMKIADLYRCLLSCLGASEPLIEQVERDVEIKKHLEATL